MVNHPNRRKRSADPAQSIEATTAYDPNANGWPKTPGLEKAARDLSKSYVNASEIQRRDFRQPIITGRVTYTSGFTFSLPPHGWFAVWESTDLIEGPFLTEEQAAFRFLTEDDRS